MAALGHVVGACAKAASQGQCEEVSTPMVAQVPKFKVMFLYIPSGEK